MGTTSLKDFFNKIAFSTPISLSQTKEVMDKRNVLMVRAQNIESHMQDVALPMPSGELQGWSTGPLVITLSPLGIITSTIHLK